MKLFALSVLAIAAMISTSARADSLSAGKCELFISKIAANPSSHGSAGTNVTVKVGWIGNDEHIQKVGYRSFFQNQDLGNAPECHFGKTPDSYDFKDMAPNSTYGTEYGEYGFSFFVGTGSVVSQCPGYHMSYTGAFFVQTDKNTYWLNPDLDPSKNYDFDFNGFMNLEREGYYMTTRTADHSNLKYYNPLNCR